MAHLAHDKDKLVARVKRIAGQLTGLERRLDEDAPCGEFLHLVAAIRGAVGGLMDELVEAHLNAHVAAPGLSDAERTAAARELAVLLRRYVS